MSASSSSRDCGAIVLGLGGLGSAALYWLARKLGSRVLGLEQFELGHDRGGSQDHSRIIRYSYHTPDYVRLAAAAYEAWGEVETEADRELIVRCGGLDFFPEDGAIPSADYTRSMAAVGVPYEEMSSSEIRVCWPQFVLPESVHGVFQSDGGYVRAALANETHRLLAVQRGARILAGVGEAEIRPAENEFVVSTDEDSFRTEKLILTAGAWTGELLAQLDLEIPLWVSQEQVTYFHSTCAEEFGADRFPIWIWNDEPCFYGFPHHETDGLKVAEDLGGRRVTAQTRGFDPDPENLARVRSFCERYLPAATPSVHYTKTCLYTLTPDRDFLLDQVPGHPGAWMAVGAGHAFKFASLLGKTLSELAIEGSTAQPIEAFRADRAALRSAGDSPIPP